MTAETFAIAKNLMSRIQDLSEKIKRYKKLPPKFGILNESKSEYEDISSEMDEDQNAVMKQYFIESYEYQLKRLKREFEKL